MPSEPGHHPHSNPNTITRRRFLTGASAAGLGLAAYAGTHGRHEFEIVNRIFPIANLPDSFQNFRIVQLSDIHLVEFTEAWFLEEMVRHVNALHPDLVLLTGDFVSHGPRSNETSWRAAGVCAEVLSGLTAPQRYGILGNHDVGVGPSHVIGPLQAHGTPVLVNSHVAIERGSGRIWLAGVDAIEGGSPEIEQSIPADPRAPVLFLCHEPDFADAVVRHPRFPLIDLMLSGHSHGGQIRLPFVGPLILPPLGKKYFEGLYRLGHMQLYVNRGLGTVGLPFRLNCAPEITQITLVRA
jgi:predicted MPP superfamily phosphohydrolase